MAEKIIQWKTSDGSVFNTEKEADKYEQETQLRDELIDILMNSQLNIGFDEIDANEFVDAIMADRHLIYPILKKLMDK